MIRRAVVMWSVLGAAVIVGLFAVKHRVQSLEERLHRLNAGIIADREAIQVLQAEWTYLNQPARLEELSRRFLDLEPVSPAQTIEMAVFKNRILPPRPAEKPVPPAVGAGEPPFTEFVSARPAEDDAAAPPAGTLAPPAIRPAPDRGPKAARKPATRPAPVPATARTIPVRHRAAPGTASPAASPTLSPAVAPAISPAVSSDTDWLAPILVNLKKHR